MCGRYTVLTEDEIIEIREILKTISLRIVKNDFFDYEDSRTEICPTDYAPVITKVRGGIAFENVKWGFKKWNDKGVIINARVETMRQKSTFSKYLETGRCVVPAGEFFEWKKLDSGKKKHYAKDSSGNLLFMAGLYRDLMDATKPNGYVREFVIITKQATGEMAKIHDRVPIILHVDQIERWLTGDLTPEEIENFEYDLSVNPCESDEQLTLF